MRNIILALIVALAGITAPMKAIATVTSSTNQVIYNGDGVTSTFNFSFNVYNSASENDLLVTKQNVSTGAVTNLTLNTDYTVALTHAVPSPGTITLTAGALASGINLSILRQLPLTQLVTESDNSATPASVRNNVYDRGVMIGQQLQQGITRAILQNVFQTTALTLPAAVANYGLCWDASATTIVNCAQLTGTIGVPIANSNLQTLTQASLVNGSSLFGSATLTGLTATTLATATLTTTGNVGIGSATPGMLLDVKGTMRVFSGNVGVGTVAPGKELDVQGTVRAASFTGMGGHGLFGAWSGNLGIGTIQAATDLIDVCGTQQGQQNVITTSDSSNPPLTVRCSAIAGAVNMQATCTVPVRKGDYYNCQTQGTGAFNYSLGIGS